MRSAATRRGVCQRCARRSWLLARLAAPLDRTARDPARLWPALVLGDEELIDALGGLRREGLREAWRRWTPSHSDGDECRPPSGSALCRHHCAYPTRMAADPLAPHALLVDGDLGALCRLDEAPLVTLVGVPEPSEYALASAGSLARDLALAGVAIACADDELGAQASSAALAAGGRAILAGDDEPAKRARGAIERGVCRVMELLPGDPPPAWSQLSHQRILTLLADLVIVVETTPSPEDGRSEPPCIELARRRGTRLAAVPGRIDSPRSEGVNMLILEGAPPVVNARVLLDTLYGVGKPRRPRHPVRRSPRRARTRRQAHGTQVSANARIRGCRASSCEQQPRPAPGGAATIAPALEPRLARVLARVKSGEDTLAKLCAGESACETFAVALTELELLGALRRSPDGSYLVS